LRYSFGSYFRGVAPSKISSIHQQASGSVSRDHFNERFFESL
jgi:hypothetical protein